MYSVPGSVPADLRVWRQLREQQRIEMRRVEHGMLRPRHGTMDDSHFHVSRTRSHVPRLLSRVSRSINPKICANDCIVEFVGHLLRQNGQSKVSGYI